MSDQNGLAEQFEAHRSHLQAVAYRMLGSLSEADDAVQETWIRLTRSNTNEVGNMGGFLTTIVSRVCLDMLRAGQSRRKELSLTVVPETAVNRQDGSNPEHEALLADSVGVAMLVVLSHLNPAERVAFVLHDVFALSFAEIAPILERNEAAVRQLASRARRRVQGSPTAADSGEFRSKRELVDAFLAASRSGDFEKLLKVLHPNVVMRNDTAFAPAANVPVVHGSQAIAKQFTGRAQGARPILVNGSVGVVVAPRGRVLFVLEFTIEDGKIVEIDMFADPKRVRKLDLAVLNDG